jgi:hypothetical protein
MALLESNQSVRLRTIRYTKTSLNGCFFRAAEVPKAINSLLNNSDLLTIFAFGENSAEFYD